ncbi:pyrimidine 5'-nucleotidase [bacterium]|nr:MAG: pyrimidine 5'-nucleotidase [bacterium]
MEPVWLIDCDNTLYPHDNGLFDRVNSLIVEYMRNEVGIPEGEVDELRLRYWKEYGLTMGGLVREHGVDAEHYLEYVHNLPVGDFLRNDPALREALSSLPGKKIVFTNATAEHAVKIMAGLGIEGVVDDIFDIRFCEMAPKPKPFGYRKALEKLGAEPGRVWFVEDDEKNLDTGRELGMVTVLVGRGEAEGHHSVANLYELPALYAKTKILSREIGPVPSLPLPGLFA